MSMDADYSVLEVLDLLRPSTSYTLVIEWPVRFPAIWCQFLSLAICHWKSVLHTITHNHFTALLEYIWDHLGEQVPQRQNQEG